MSRKALAALIATSITTTAVAANAFAASMECRFLNRDDNGRSLTTGIRDGCMVLRLKPGACTMFFPQDANRDNLATVTAIAPRFAGSLTWSVSGEKKAYVFTSFNTSSDASGTQEMFAPYAASDSHAAGSFSVKCKPVGDDVLQDDIKAGACTDFPMSCL